MAVSQNMEGRIGGFEHENHGGGADAVARRARDSKTAGTLAQREVTSDGQDQDPAFRDHKWQPGFVVETSHNDHHSAPQGHQIQRTYYTENPGGKARKKGAKQTERLFV
jgi:hypothetical protein